MLEERGDERISRAVVTSLLILQLAILWISMAVPHISPMCTSAKTLAWRLVGHVHGMYFALLIVGSVAAFVPRIRIWYVALLLLGLSALPLQAYGFEQGILTCDVP